MHSAAKADDLFSLHKAFDLYFVTESGKQAGLRLIDAHLENGEFAAAAWIGEQLLNMHPNLLVEKPAVLFRTALAYHLSGSADKAAERRGASWRRTSPRKWASCAAKTWSWLRRSARR